MDPPSSLSLEEIRKYMLLNNCKVTNHALVKHFRKYLTNPDSQEEARKLFKSYVNILATMKNENNEKYLVLRKKYLHECPPEDIVNKTIECPSPASPGNSSIASDNFGSPFRQPPPYKPPPEVSPNVSGLPKVSSVLSSPTVTPVGYGVGVPKEMTSNYRECVNEFAAAVRKIDPNRLPEISTSPITSQDTTNTSGAVIIRQNVDVIMQEQPPILPPRKRSSIDQNSITLSRENSREENKENVDGKGNNNAANMQRSISNTNNDIDNKLAESENQISVKEATRKFNRMASEEEAKVVSPPSKKKPEKTVEEAPEVTLAHPKAKEWLVSAAKANYQELAKLLADYPELVRLQDPSTTGLHWAAKHGNEDVVKLIAGTYKANVNAKTNGGYTPLHLAMQFGRDNIFELLCNVYKANRDITDWSGNKPLDYRRQRTTVSASTYSKIKAKKKNIEKDSGFLRIGSLNVRVKKTTEAFSNFLGVGGSNGNTNQNNHHHYHQQSQQHSGMMLPPQNHRAQMNRASIPAHLHNNNNVNNKNEKIHKTWGSVDNIPKPYDKNAMPPPKNSLSKRSKTKRSTTYSQQDGYNSMPSTPNQLTTDKKFLSHDQKIIFQDSDDSDTAAGFDSSWTKPKF